MAYTPDKPKLAESSDDLRARIPGWGADLDPKDRPSVPQEVFDPDLSGAHWEFPERQPERWPRERSIEHKFLTPVFGTSTPPRGLSGAIRRYSYAKYSEGRAAHWLLLLAADRVDVAESRLRSLVTGRPDRLIHETGVRSELSHHGLRSRLGRNRTDVTHHPLDPAIAAAPYLIGAGLGYAIMRRMARNR
ncbi:hypothetical protein OHA21_11920 [Actinoplanes sp. NBC_00393]|uniref:hypothetical protein n=1 Tax=Actinoplanes sp. NBC_00393 TaxID=2975953 RepID=UPI002E2116DA